MKITIPSSKLTIIIPVLLIFATVSVYGFSFITGNGSDKGVANSYAAANQNADINKDGFVNIQDLSVLLTSWNTNNINSDISQDGYVNISDLSILLSSWGALSPVVTGFPDSSNTGPRVPDNQLTPSSGVTTERDGQVIEKLLITSGRIKIMHSNVIVRDVKIIHTSPNDGSYPFYVIACSGCAAPTNVLIEYVEVDGQAGIGEGTPAVYGPAGNWTLRYADIHGMGSGPRITDNTVIEYSYVHDMASLNAAEHKSGIGLNGGANHVIRHNNIDCDAPGCSSALSLYGSNARVENVLVENNLFNTTGSYCTYGGSVTSKAFPIGYNIRYLNNTFGRKHNPECGQYGFMASWNSNNGANVWSGNKWGNGAAANSNHATDEIINM